ncbi:calcium-binding tyrosine phosphorylation-regulated protein isoform X3 [Pantherophis guttatus]|uniref:Calcium-binding tyrosine phosphorylation-regulated protein n=1 Tax=Pantherophis guttatus TaxID=94885 RepID=A0A6P9CM41_PANGU|nr:calcium-binding tyrosine phosphorylation-regulated protein isoform X3 [Pantherophis guttatus]
MHTAKPRMVVPYGLKTLLEGVSRAVLKASPSNITEFAAEYFKELIVFREEHPNLDIKELVREFHVTRVEGWAEGPGAATQMPRSKRADVGDAFRSDLDTIPIHDEPKRKEKSTDTEEDQISEESRELSTKTTQFPSIVDEFVEKVGDDKGAGLAYIPADPAQLASQMLDDAECDPDRMDTTEQLKSTDPGFIMSVAIPLEDVMNGKNGTGAGDKAAFAGSYGIAGEITFTTASVRRTE